MYDSAQNTNAQQLGGRDINRKRRIPNVANLHFSMVINEVAKPLNIGQENIGLSLQWALNICVSSWAIFRLLA